MLFERADVGREEIDAGERGRCRFSGSLTVFLEQVAPFSVAAADVEE
jgi:hypothetical protein